MTEGTAVPINSYTRDDAITINPSAIPLLFDFPTLYIEPQDISVLKIGDCVRDESGETKVFLGTDRNGSPAWAHFNPVCETGKPTTDDDGYTMEEFQHIYEACRFGKEQSNAQLSDELFHTMLNAENN